MAFVGEKNGYRIWTPDGTLGRGASADEKTAFVVEAAAMALADGDPSAASGLVRSKLPLAKEFASSLDFGENGTRAAALLKGANLGRTLVYGDYDADGICSAVLAAELVRFRSDEVSIFVPHRYEQGYGLHEDEISRRAGTFDTLVVTDCGTGEFELLEKTALSCGRVVVFDHHEQGDSPVHTSVVNFKTRGDGTVGREMCAAGLVWMWALAYGMADDDELARLSWLAAVGTVGDCMELTPLNRRIVADGLESMAKNPDPRIERLMKGVGLSRSLSTGLYGVSSTDIAMRIAPCVNAAGRMEDVRIAVDAFFGGHDWKESMDRLVTLNEQRKEASGLIVSEARERFSHESGVVKGEWPVGVISGAAGAVCSSEKRPTILATEVNGKVRGTSRAPEGGDVLKALASVADSLDSWGGHKRAAGFSCSLEKWPFVAERLRREFESMELEYVPRPAFEIPPWAMSVAAWRAVSSAFGPFGQGNPAPVVHIRNDGRAKASPLGKNGGHMKLEFPGVSVLAFGCTDGSALLEAEGWLCEPSVNSWQGKETLQFILSDVSTDREQELKIG